ncbi:methyl-accepting chemotaxis protein [Thermodesulfobacteriota bacterium]
MASLIGRSLMFKLVVFFVLVTVIPILLAGYISFRSSRTSLKKSEFDRLASATELKRSQILQAFEAALHNSEFLAHTDVVRSAVETLVSYHEFGKASADAPFDFSSDLYEKLYGKTNPLFQQFMETHQTNQYGCSDILIVCAKMGHVMYTAEREKDLGGNVKTGDLKDTPLGQVWRKVVKTGKPALIDYSLYKPVGDLFAFLGVPVRGKEDELAAVFIMRLGFDAVSRIASEGSGQALSANVYIIGDDRKLRASSSGPAVESGEQLQSQALATALKHESGIAVIENHKGERVLSSFSHAGINENEALGADFDWAILVEVPVSRAFAPVNALGIRILIVALFMAVGAGLAGFLMARATVRPIVALGVNATRISEGDLTVDVPAKDRQDEIGKLAAAFQKMVNHLRDQTRQVMEGVNILTASTSEISATVSQLAASTSKTSAAVTQATTTVEEVKQAARVSSEKAKRVAQSAKQAENISDSGKQATENTIYRMNLIKEQMESIGQTVVKLSAHGEAIGDIIEAVQDLADQSNLLAVNASIEAARAGEQGKGFAVVAQEIKTLADQSKEATKQVRNLLQDTKRNVTAVVLATEEGGKAVEAGVEESVLAGESIQALTISVAESSQAATVIDTSSEQQFIGIDQVAGAMSNIESAMAQNLDGTTQLETAARRLEDLGNALLHLISSYKV